MKILANCKINLGLDILRRREDGYHDLQTVMLPVRELHDVVEVEKNDTGGVRFRSAGIPIDCPEEKNLCIKAYRLMQERFGIGGADIALDKRVPFGAGLGGGSSDATAVILALNELYGLGLGETELIGLAAELGSDTAFFVRNTPQLCEGRGEVMTPVDIDLSGLWLVLVKPDEGVSTREAYSGVVPQVPETPLTARLSLPVWCWQGVVTNDFEESVFALHPAIAEVKSRLLAGGALYAAMSGSGSTVFALFDDEKKCAPFREMTPYVFHL